GINISLDSLHPERFFQITRRDDFAKVWDNLEKMLELDIPTKLNMVVMAGVNDDEIIDFALLAQEKKLSVRFIEAMPFNAGDGNRSTYLSAAAIKAKLLEAFPTLYTQPLDPNAATDRYHVPGWEGSLGIIPAYSRSLCGRCNRLRLTPKGELLNCLYTQKGVALLPLLRQGATDEELLELIQAYLFTKAKDGHEAERLAGQATAYASMTTIGG
ncbi:MAG: radical SAM protein, partial [Bacteroidota bacterium]